MRAALNPLLVALAAHQAVRTVLQTITSLFKGRDPGPAEQPEPPGAAHRPAPSKENPYKPAEPPSEPKPSDTPKLPPADQTPSAVLRGFTGPKSMRKWQNQMIERGWTAPQIEEAIQNGRRYPAENRVNPGNGATRYVHPETGRSAVIDDTTGQVIQLGGDRFDHD